MQAPRIPHNEHERLTVLRELLVLDTAPEERFDVLTQFCMSRFNVPIALVSLVDHDRQWFKSACGIDAKETSREISFCGHAILQDAPLVVENAKLDQRFHDNPLVDANPHIRFYAGAPLNVNGYNVGTLCLIDSKPRRFDQEDIQALTDLASLVVEQLKTKPA